MQLYNSRCNNTILGLVGQGELALLRNVVTKTLIFISLHLEASYFRMEKYNFGVSGAGGALLLCREM